MRSLATLLKWQEPYQSVLSRSWYVDNLISNFIIMDHILVIQDQAPKFSNVWPQEDDTSLFTLKANTWTDSKMKNVL